MGALCLLPPGKGALCATACEHEACRLVREIAAKACMLCKKELGFGVPIYCYPTRLGHADNLDEAYEQAVLRFAEDLGRLVADLYLRGKLPELDAEAKDAEPEQEPKRKRRTKKPATQESNAPSSESCSQRYLLPEFDLHAEIPAGRGPRNRKSKRLEQHHHLLWPGDAEPVDDLE